MKIMSHMAALNDNNWATMLNLMNTSMTTLTAQLSDAKVVIEEKNSEIRELQFAHAKEISNLQSQIKQLEARIKINEKSSEGFKNFSFEDTCKPQSYASIFFKKACNMAIEKYNLRTLENATTEEKITSKRNREEAAQEVLSFCQITEIDEKTLSKTRMKISSIMADAKYYSIHKEEIDKKRSEKKRKIESTKNKKISIIPNDEEISVNVTVPDLSNINYSFIDYSVLNDYPINSSVIGSDDNIFNSSVSVNINSPVIGIDDNNLISSVPVKDKLNNILSSNDNIDFLSVPVIKFDPEHPNKREDIIVGNIVAMAFVGEKRNIYYGEILKIRGIADATKAQVKYYHENDDGKLEFLLKPEVTWEKMKYGIHTNITLTDDGHVNELNDVTNRYMLYSDMWF